MKSGDYVGVYTQLQGGTRNEQVAVGTNSKILAEARQGLQPRQNIIIRNTSSDAADIITVNLGYGPAAAGAGIVLKKDESFTDSSENGYDCWQGVITAIGATANCQVAIYER